MPDLPRITVITPSFNQASFIAETIQSVLGQGYPNLQYLVMDGGSTDGTLEILKRFEGQIEWSSEKDRGQADAINKGFRRASGEIVAYLNSDDRYEPGALLAVGRYFSNHPQAVWLTGRCRIIDEQGQAMRSAITLYKNLWLRLGSYRVLQVLNYISQPATFWRRSAMDLTGLLDENLHYTLDYDLWLRLGTRHRLHILTQTLASFRMHSRSKSRTGFQRQFDEDLEVAQRYCKGFPILLHRLHSWAIVTTYTFLTR